MFFFFFFPDFAFLVIFLKCRALLKKSKRTFWGLFFQAGSFVQILTSYFPWLAPRPSARKMKEAKHEKAEN